MAPKVKTTTPPADPESMATQPDSPAEKTPEEELETQCPPEPDAPPKRKRGRPKGKPSGSTATKRRRTQAPLVKNVISKNLNFLVHTKIVQQVIIELKMLDYHPPRSKDDLLELLRSNRIQEDKDKCTSAQACAVGVEFYQRLYEAARDELAASAASVAFAA